MHLVYSVFGLRLYANLPLPGLTPLTFATDSDVQVWLQSPLPALNDKGAEAELLHVSPYQDEQGEPVVKAWKLMGGSFFRLRYSDGTEFVIDGEGARIWCTWPENLTIEDTTVYLLGPIFGFVLRLRGTVCLHASAISIGDYAIALLGPAGAGKSTTAAALAKSGFPVISDDVLALSDSGGTFIVQPAYPRLRLWPAAVNILYGTPDALPRLIPGDSSWDKRYLNLTGKDYRFQQKPLPLAAIYLLSERAENPTAPLIEPLRAQAGLISLIANTYANNLLDPPRRAQEFEFLNRIISHVPLRRVTPHADPFYLPRLCDVILDDLHHLFESGTINAKSRITAPNG